MDAKRMLMPGDFVELYTIEEFKRIYHQIGEKDPEDGSYIFFNGDEELYNKLDYEELAKTKCFKIYLDCVPFGEVLRVHKAYDTTITVVDNKNEYGYYPYTIDKRLIKNVRFNIRWRSLH